jgi:hypothetical protein
LAQAFVLQLSRAQTVSQIPVEDLDTLAYFAARFPGATAAK